MKNTATLLFLIIFGCSFGQYKNLKIDRSLLLQLPMNGNIKDSSPLALKTTCHNLETVPDKNNNENGAFSFENSGYIQIENIEAFRNLQTFSLCCWVYLTTYSGHGNIFSKASPGRDFNLQIDENGQVNFHFYDENYYHWYSKAKLDLKKWYHIVLVFDKNEVNLFINGKKAQTNTYFPDTYDNKIPFYKKIKWEGQELFIGNISTYAGECFPGYLDDTRIYEKAITPIEITDIMKLKNIENNKKYVSDFESYETQYKQSTEERIGTKENWTEPVMEMPKNETIKSSK